MDAETESIAAAPGAIDTTTTLPPAAGGSYIADPVTGALSLTERTKQPGE